MKTLRLLLCSFLLAAIASPGWAIGFASGWAGSTFTTTATTTGGTTQASGSIFLIGVDAGTSISSVADSFSNTYTLKSSQSVAFGASTLALYACTTPCTGGASHTATATMSGGSKLAVALIEIPSASAIDVVSAGSNNGTTGTTLAATSITTTVANEWVINLFGSAGNQINTLTDSGSGFAIASSQQTASTFNCAFTYAQPVSSSTAAADTLTVSVSDGLGALGISIKPAVAVVNGVMVSNGHPVQSGTSILYK